MSDLKDDPMTPREKNLAYIGLAFVLLTGVSLGYLIAVWTL